MGGGFNTLKREWVSGGLVCDDCSSRQVGCQVSKR